MNTCTLPTLFRRSLPKATTRVQPGIGGSRISRLNSSDPHNPPSMTFQLSSPFIHFWWMTLNRIWFELWTYPTIETVCFVDPMFKAELQAKTSHFLYEKVMLVIDENGFEPTSLLWTCSSKACDLQALDSKSMLEIIHSPENLKALPLGPNLRSLQIGLVHSFDTCRWSDVAGHNGRSDSNSSGPKTASKSDSSFLIAELAPSMFHTCNLSKACVGHDFKSTPSREIFKLFEQAKITNI